MIDFVEKNLVWNDRGEVFAYYELLPYNYSFLSLAEKEEIQARFASLVGTYKAGKIHALEIATKRSLSQIEAQSKTEIRGPLKEFGLKNLSLQTECLRETQGEFLIDYRYFIGFQLLVTDAGFSFHKAWGDLRKEIENFVYSVNHRLMGEMVRKSEVEIHRYQLAEELLFDRLQSRFSFRKLDAKDIGYLLAHFQGNDAVSYEDFDFSIPKEARDGYLCTKKYMAMAPGRSHIEEHLRHLKIDTEAGTHYVSYLTIHYLTGELLFPSSEFFYYQSQRFPFPVDTSMHVTVIPNEKAVKVVRGKKMEMKDMDEHAWKSGEETGGNVLAAKEELSHLEDTLEATRENMYELSFLVRVVADSEEQLTARLAEVKDFYEQYHVKMLVPMGDMIGFHREFYPASERYRSDYVQHVRSDFLSSLGFGATQKLGEDFGLYIGYSLDSGKNVYIRPQLAAQGVKGSVTNALAAAFLGSLGGGKSFANNLIVYLSVLAGAKALIIDPKSERGGWEKALPELAGHVQILNFTSEEGNRGLLDPYVILQDRKDSDSLALEILTYLTGVSPKDGEKFPILRSAVHRVSKRKRPGLFHVIEELSKEKNPVGDVLAAHISSFLDYDFAKLLFSDGTVKRSISFLRSLNIVQIEDLTLPTFGTPPEDYTSKEMISISLLMVLSMFALDFIKLNRGVFKIVDIDEAWNLLNVPQGRLLADRLVREGRSRNAGVYFVTQSTKDLASETIQNNIGMKFAFRSRNQKEVQEVLSFFGLDPTEESNQKRLQGLENGQCLFQDIYGHVGVIQIDPLFSDLFAAFDTRPQWKPEEVVPDA